MEALRQYVLSVTAAALLCSILTALLGKQGTVGTIGKLLCGIFLAVTVLRPLLDFSVGDLTDVWYDYSQQAQTAVEEGEELSANAISEIIMQQSQSYILDKADLLGVSVTVDVMLTDDALPVPKSVTIQGDVSPYQRKQLSALLEQDLGIPEEQQLWIR